MSQAADLKAESGDTSQAADMVDESANMSQATDLNAGIVNQHFLIGGILPNQNLQNAHQLVIQNYQMIVEKPPTQPVVIIELEDNTFDLLLEQQPTVVIRRKPKSAYTKDELILAFHMITIGKLRPVEAQRYFGIPYTLFFREWRKYKKNPFTYIPSMKTPRRRGTTPTERNVVSGGFNLFSPVVGMFVKGKYTAVVP